jgi:cold shock protein
MSVIKVGPMPRGLAPLPTVMKESDRQHWTWGLVDEIASLSQDSRQVNLVIERKGPILHSWASSNENLERSGCADVQPHDTPIWKKSYMTQGTVKFFDGQRGFGFIQPDDGGKDVFVHISAVERAGMRALNEGQKIAFDVVADRKTGKSSADNLQAVWSAARKTIILTTDVLAGDYGSRPRGRFPGTGLQLALNAWFKLHRTPHFEARWWVWILPEPEGAHPWHLSSRYLNGEYHAAQ